MAMWKVKFKLYLPSGQFYIIKYRYRGTYIQCLKNLIETYSLDDIDHIRVFNMKNIWYRRWCRRIKQGIRWYLCLEDR